MYLSWVMLIRGVVICPISDLVSESNCYGPDLTGTNILSIVSASSRSHDYHTNKTQFTSKSIGNCCCGWPGGGAVAFGAWSVSSLSFATTSSFFSCSGGGLGGRGLRSFMSVLTQAEPI